MSSIICSELSFCFRKTSVALKIAVFTTSQPKLTMDAQIVPPITIRNAIGWIIVKIEPASTCCIRSIKNIPTNNATNADLFTQTSCNSLIYYNNLTLLQFKYPPFIGYFASQKNIAEFNTFCCYF